MLELGLALGAICVIASALAVGLGMQRVERRVDAMADLMGLPPVRELPRARVVRR